MSNIDISFITINYNSSEFTTKLLESITHFTQLNYEVIIVDNASQKEDLAKLKKSITEYKNIKLVENKINSGFASGNMLGVNYASGEHLFFINNDTVLLNDCASVMQSFLEKNSKVALCTAKVNDEKGNFSSSYTIFPSLTKEILGNSIARKFNKFPSNKIKLQEPTKVEVVSGACMFFRASSFREIGGFDTNFFLYCEEEDISKRVWLNNEEVYFLPDATILHHSGGSTEKSLAILKEYYISYKHLIFKHFSLLESYILMFMLFIKLLRRSFKSKNGFALLLFALKGFAKKESLRYKQKLIS